MSQTNGTGQLHAMMATHSHHEMTTRDYIKVLFRHKFIIILTILTVTVATYLGLQLQTPVYEAQVKMLIAAQKQIDTPYYKDVLEGRNVQAAVTQSEVVKSKPVLERTIAALSLQKRPMDYERHYATPIKQMLIDAQVKKMNLDRLTPQGRDAMTYRFTFEDLKKRITVEPIRDTNLFWIKVTDFSPIGAAIIANTLSRAYVIFDLEQQFVDLQSKYTEKNPIVVQLKENISKMEAGLSGQPLPNIDALGPGSVKIIEQSTPPLKPNGISKKITLILAFMMSIFLGLFLAFAFEYMDQTFHSKQDLETFLGVPVIACINKKRNLGDVKVVRDVSDSNKSPRAVSYRILASQVLFLVKTKGYKTLFFTSVHPKDDSSVILANVATYLSKRLGLRTLMIDANFRKPHLNKLFNIQSEQGIAQVLEGRVNPEEVIRPAGDKLDMITSGRSLADPGILLDANSFSKALSTLKALYDVILVDGAVLRDYRDSAIIAPSFDGMLLVIGESTVRKQVVRYSVKHLRDTNCKVAGVIMPNRHYLLPKFVYESV